MFGALVAFELPVYIICEEKYYFLIWDNGKVRINRCALVAF